MPATSRICAVAVLATGFLFAPQSPSVTQSVAMNVSPANVKIIDNKVSASLTGSPGDPIKGKKTFLSRKQGNCLACHVNKDMKDQPFHGEIGPPLDGVASRYAEAELRAILVNAKAVLGEQTIMPSFYRVINKQRTRKEFHDKTILSAGQIEDVIAYLKTLKE